MDSLYFEPCDLPPKAEALRGEIRDFLADNLSPYSPEVRSRSWAGGDPEFSQKLGEAGFCLLYTSPSPRDRG